MSISKSESLFARSRKVSPGGVHSPVRAFKSVGGIPRFVESAKGSRLRDVDGNEYVDFSSSWGPMILGHQDEEVSAALHEALGRGWTYGTADTWSLELAELITGSVACVEKVRFVNSGTEAVMSALRLARAATGRTRILKFDGCYHGHSDGMLVKAGSGLADLGTPDSAGVSNATASETLVAPLNDLKAIGQIFEQHGKSIAAVIVEPIPANYGLLPQATGFLEELAKLTKQAGALLIFDEVITGFRMGFGGMSELTGIEPDLITYGKIIGGGFPVGAYAGKSEIMDRVAPAGPVYQAGTLSANPMAMCAGLTTLKKLKRDDPYSELERKTLALAESLAKACPGLRVQTAGSMFWPVLGARSSGDAAIRTPNDIPPLHREQYAKIFHGVLDKGFYLPPSSVEVCFLSTAHTDSDLSAFTKSWTQEYSKMLAEQE